MNKRYFANVNIEHFYQWLLDRGQGVPRHLIDAYFEEVGKSKFVVGEVVRVKENGLTREVIDHSSDEPFYCWTVPHGPNGGIDKVRTWSAEELEVITAPNKRNTMNLKRLIYRERQQCLCDEERGEVLSLWEVEINGHTGLVSRKDTYHKRDGYSEWFATSKELLQALRDEDRLWRFDEEMWKMKPENERQTDEVVRLIESCTVSHYELD